MRKSQTSHFCSHKIAGAKKIKKYFAVAVMRVVDYILLSEFDIDCGSVLSVQYPQKVPLPKEYKEEKYADLIANVMLPDGCQNSEWDHSFFMLRYPTSSDGEKTLYGLNIVCRKLDESVRRGAIVKAISILSFLPEVCFTNGWATGLFPLLRAVLLDFFKTNTTNKAPPDLSSLSQLFSTLNEATNAFHASKIRNTVPSLEYAQRSMFNHSYCNYNQVKYRIHIPLFHHSSGFAVGSISNLIRLLGINALMSVYRAIIQEKNILFLAHNISASELCTQVMTSVLLVSPVISNLLENRVFPYVSFNDLEFQSQKGFIAGTTNPFFKESCNYFLLVDLNEGEVSVKGSMDNKKKRRGGVFGQYGKSEDADFCKHITSGMDRFSLGETWLKRQFQSYTLRISDVAAEYPDTPDRFFESMAHHTMNLRNSSWIVKQAVPDSAVPSLIRKLFYAMNGLYKKMCSGTILSCLMSLCDVAKNQEIFLRIIEHLLKYFGTVDLSDAIERVTGTQDHENIERFQWLNSELLATYTNIFSDEMHLLQL